MPQGLQKYKIHIRNGQETTASVSENLHSALAKAGGMLDASCGGKGTCGKCKIKVLTGRVGDSQGNPAFPRDDGSFLACQVYPLEDLTVEEMARPDVSAKGEIGGRFISQEALDPIGRKLLINPIYPDLENPYSLQEMLQLSCGGIKPTGFDVLKELAAAADKGSHPLTVTLIADEMTAVEKGDVTSVQFGIAFDIGSTTVAGMLVDLTRGEVLAAAAETNPQAAYGADVISRIKYAGQELGLQELSALIRKCLNDLIDRLCSAQGIARDDVFLVTVAGNSTMEHLLTGISPASLTMSPYVPVFNHMAPLPPEKLELAINPRGRIVLLPNIASFVGADTVAGIVAVDQDLTDEMTLLIDLGTNGELALGSREKIVVCSTAAGPAFEGAQLSCGMRAVAGAIDTVAVDEDIHWTTIKHEKPKGICGSGIIKAIAELVRAGVITPSGRFASGSQVEGLPSKVRERLREKNGRKEFVLAFAGHSGTGEDIVVTQGDIREIQLVKSSICTGAQILMEALGVSEERIDQVLIAGAFGNYIDLDSAVTLGLIPVGEKKKILPVGNAAGSGAVKALLSKEHWERCLAVSKRAGFVELANNPQFQSKFVQNLSFIGGAR